MESSLAEGEGGWWGLIVCLKKDQMGKITQTALQFEDRQGLLHHSLLQSLDSKKGLELELMQQPGSGGGSLGQPRDRHTPRVGTGVRNSGLEIRGQGAAMELVRTLQLVVRKRCVCSAAASPGDHGMSSTCQEAVTSPSPLEAGCTEADPKLLEALSLAELPDQPQVSDT